MTSKKLIIAGIFTVCTFILTNCDEPGKTYPPENSYGETLSRHNLKYDTLTGYFYAGPMSGNGLIGAVIHKMEADV